MPEALCCKLKLFSGCAPGCSAPFDSSELFSQAEVLHWQQHSSNPLQTSHFIFTSQTTMQLRALLAKYLLPTPQPETFIQLSVWLWAPGIVLGKPPREGLFTQALVWLPGSPYLNFPLSAWRWHDCFWEMIGRRTKPKSYHLPMLVMALANRGTVLLLTFCIAMDLCSA